MTTWSELFDRADGRAVSLSAIRDELGRRRADAAENGGDDDA